MKWRLGPKRAGLHSLPDETQRGFVKDLPAQ